MRLAVIQRDLAEDGPAVTADAEVVISRANAERVGAAGQLGRVVTLVGDECFDFERLEELLADPCDTLVMVPESESDLQAEAALELAIGLSESAAGLVIVVQDDGAEPGEPGHGGSAVVLLGEVLAEALGGADVVAAEIPLPVPQPVPRDPLPQVPPILVQRLAHHRGRRPEVGYPSDV